MLFTTLLLASAPFFATAQLATPTISLPGLQLPTALPTAVPGGDLLGLVGQLPSCALGCLDDAAGNINCTTSDLTCLCSKSSELVGAIGPCLLLSSDCSSNETNSESFFSFLFYAPGVILSHGYMSRVCMRCVSDTS